MTATGSGRHPAKGSTPPRLRLIHGDARSNEDDAHRRAVPPLEGESAPGRRRPRHLLQCIWSGVQGGWRSFAWEDFDGDLGA